ncbi:MAG: hypothetical protein U9Q15_00990 [Patescibacteria group bacterium]|nr:hypothetical protein [Patescibacteria group bacterium]
MKKLVLAALAAGSLSVAATAAIVDVNITNSDVGVSQDFNISSGDTLQINATGFVAGSYILDANGTIDGFGFQETVGDFVLTQSDVNTTVTDGDEVDIITTDFTISKVAGADWDGSFVITAVADPDTEVPVINVNESIINLDYGSSVSDINWSSVYTVTDNVDTIFTPVYTGLNEVNTSVEGQTTIVYIDVNDTAGNPASQEYVVFTVGVQPAELELIPITSAQVIGKTIKLLPVHVRQMFEDNNVTIAVTDDQTDVTTNYPVAWLSEDNTSAGYGMMEYADINVAENDTVTFVGLPSNWGSETVTVSNSDTQLVIGIDQLFDDSQLAAGWNLNGSCIDISAEQLSMKAASSLNAQGSSVKPMSIWNYVNGEWSLAYAGFNDDGLIDPNDTIGLDTTNQLETIPANTGYWIMTAE